MSSRLLLGLVVLASLVVVAPAQAAPGALNILVTGNQGGTPGVVATAISAKPGVAVATPFQTNAATPTADVLSGYDLVVSIGDSDYLDAALWGNRLADYVDAGGAVLQTAYDNWDDTGSPAPTGRFASGNYPPLLVGPNDNVAVTLGAILAAGHPLLQDLGTFPSSDNTNTPLAPGATLLAKWSDGRNAIAFKNRVAAVSASPGDATSIPGIAQLAVNTGNYLGRHNLTVGKSGTGTGTVTSAPSGISCGASCTSLLPFGTSLALTPTPAPNSQFKGWTGACTGSRPCTPTVAGAELSVGAVFDLATFGSKTLVTLSPVSKKVSGGRIKVRVKNSNGFDVTGALSARTSSKVSTSSLRFVNLKSKKLSLKAGKTKTVTLKLPSSLKRILARTGKLKLTLSAKLKSPSGTSRTVKKRVTFKPKR